MTAEWPEPDGTVEIEPQAEPERRGGFRWTGLSTVALIPLAAVVWWVVGFLPWILSGLTFVDGGRHAALPLLAGNLSVLLVGGGFGGLLCGLLATIGHGARVRNAAAVIAGVTVATAVTLVQSNAAFGDADPAAFSNADRVLVGLTLVVIAATIIGLAWGLLALAGPVGLGLALAGAAGAIPIWSSYVLVELGFDNWDPLVRLDQAARWIGAAVLALGLVRIGIRPAARLVWWPVAIVLAWLVQPTAVAGTYMEQALRPGTTWSTIVDFHLPAAWDACKASASLDARSLTPWVVAVVVAAVGAVAVRRVRARQDERGPSPDRESVNQ